MKHKTKTGALPSSAGFPGTNMIKPKKSWMQELEERSLVEMRKGFAALFLRGDSSYVK